MTLATEVRSSTSLVVVLPERAFTRGGTSFDPRGDLWQWADGPFNARVDFRRYGDGFEAFVPPLKHALLSFVKGHSSSHVMNLQQAFSHFVGVIRTCPEGSINVQHISQYKATLDKYKIGKFGLLNALLQKWVALGLAGVELECATYLRESRKPGYTKGEAVRTRDPVKGPLNEAEYTALCSSANAAYGRGELPLWTLLLTRLLLACGGRICQYASLKLGDFDGTTLVLGLPQAKAREQHTRSRLLLFDISSHTGQLIAEYVIQLKAAGYDNNSAFFPEKLVMPQGTLNRHDFTRHSRAAGNTAFHIRPATSHC